MGKWLGFSVFLAGGMDGNGVGNGCGVCVDVFLFF